MANNQSGGSGGGDKKKAGVSDMILGAMKSRSGKETTKWINNLTNEGLQEIENANLGPTAQTALPAQFAHPSIAQTQVKWVDRLFDLLQQYEVDFNRASQIPDLRVGTERAVITPDMIARIQSNDQYHYSGRLHTRFWTMAIRGNLSHIEAYIIPSDHYIGFENNIGNYVRCFEFIPMWDGELKWSFERGSIAFEQLPAMSKLIFGHLIKVAKGDIDCQEPFSYGISAPAPVPKPMSGPALQGSSASQSGDSSPIDYLKSHSGVFDDGKPILSPSPPAGTFANQKKDFSSPAASSVGDIDIAAACDILGKAIGNELDILSKAGARAFENHDFSEVEKLMKRTTKLKNMREKMLATIMEWKQALAED